MKSFADKRSARIILWAVALAGTVLLGSYQRRTGPSWPVPVSVEVAGHSVKGELPRTHGGEGGAEISLDCSSPEVEARVAWRRYPTNDPWVRFLMRNEDGQLVAELPHQPPAGKLEYSIQFKSADQSLTFPADETVVIRFRGDVPWFVLIPHILFMFLALTFSVRAVLGAILAESGVSRFVPRILLLLIPGGLILGPIVQKLAFGAYWTGWPFGGDWTDNKTLAAVAAWALAWAISRWKPSLQRPAVMFAAAVMLAVYLIPHSIHGSEVDWDQETPATTTTGAVISVGPEVLMPKLRS